MARLLDDRPRGAPVWVQATLLHASLSSLVSCGGQSGGDQRHNVAPTCGPCCHQPSGGECQQIMEEREPPAPMPDAGPLVVAVDAAPPPDAGPRTKRKAREILVPVETKGPDSVAPTCGPCCHGGGPECSDGPVAP